MSASGAIYLRVITSFSLFSESADLLKELRLIRGAASSMYSCILKADYSID